MYAPIGVENILVFEKLNDTTYERRRAKIPFDFDNFSISFVTSIQSQHPKKTFRENLNTIRKVGFALTLGLHNDNHIQTDRN